MKLHRLLERQAKRRKVDWGKLSPEVLALLADVNATYEESDKDRALLERSLDLSSDELGIANRALIRKNANLTLLGKVTSLMQFWMAVEDTLREIADELARMLGLPAVAIQIANAAAGKREIETVSGMSAVEWSLVDRSRVYSIVVLDEGEAVGSLSVLRREEDLGDVASELSDVLMGVAAHIGAWIGARRSEALLEDQRIQLANSAKMSALGQMTGGIAHEINNPIAVILSLAEEILDAGETSSDPRVEMADLARRICATAQRVAKIVSGLRNFSRDGQRDAFETADLKKIFDETEILCAERFRRFNVELSSEGLRTGLQIECQPVQVSQILVNLLHNALDAVKDLPARWVKVVTRDLGASVEVRVIDSGGGISEIHRAQLFQAFFTTKKAGSGTGLGLNISRGIAVSHGGSLTVDHRHSNTCFVLTLPKRRLGTRV